jgi:hypothetical protein
MPSPHTAVETQLPPEHTCPDPHTRPHAPQLNVSELVSRQLPPQSVPLRHWHAPPAQYCDDGHVRPHDPQLNVSELVSTQFPPQAVPLTH